MYYSNAGTKCYKELPFRITKNYNVWTCCSLRPASLRSGVRRSDNQSDTKRYPKRYPNLACVTPRPHSRAPKQQQHQQHWAHPQKDTAPLPPKSGTNVLSQAGLASASFSLCKWFGTARSKQAKRQSQSSSSDSSSSSSTEDEEDMCSTHLNDTP